MMFIAVKNFERYQHYKDRRPPWIKLYNDLLDDYAFLALPEVAQRHLVMIWLIASRHDNRIPDDLTYLAHAIHAKGRVDFSLLFDAGFLSRVEQDASAPLAKVVQSASANGAERSGNAMPHARGRASRETEKEAEPEGEQAAALQPARARVEEFVEQFPETHREDVRCLLVRVGDRAESWMRSLEARITGLHPPVVPVDIMAESIRQLNTNGGSNWRAFEGYVRRVMAGPPPDPVFTANGSRVPTDPFLAGLDRLATEPRCPNP